MGQLDPYPLRLPAYRSSYRLRFHPYPRTTPSRIEDRYMTTVDLRTVGDDVVVEEVPMSNMLNAHNTDEDAECDTILLHEALFRNVHVAHHGLGRVTFATLVVDLALAVKRGCKRVLARKKFRSSQVSTENLNA
ncbi:hypothetical protein EW026_g3309 [Hermanssonia centrifuga]|uniref:Uncharacterized protein n=1 Tax=Hermanssonia centrifuga TaxID=98765 RepID=A0A4V3XAP7_9APHY|nr:hypothetical protein EW026_g3309 [Hermanssonia centrifuga]